MIPHGGLKSTKKVQSEEKIKEQNSLHKYGNMYPFFIEHLCRKNNAHRLSDEIYLSNYLVSYQVVPRLEKYIDRSR